MIIYAICRDYEPGDKFPYVLSNSYQEGEVQYHPCDDTRYPCLQPDELDNSEFNLIIVLNGRPVLARSWHFDFE